MSYPRKTIKRYDATRNSQHHMRGCRTYYGVDKRYYNTEPSEPIPEPITDKDIKHLERREMMSMLEIYRLERFLDTGSRALRGVYVKPADRDRILLEYGLIYDQQHTRYTGDLDYVWSVLSGKFPETAGKYAGYKECQYALKYNAMPQAWSKKEGE